MNQLYEVIEEQSRKQDFRFCSEGEGNRIYVITFSLVLFISVWGSETHSAEPSGERKKESGVKFSNDSQ